jgi:hypothetical protein
MNKVHWSDLTPKEQRNFGDGCTFVPDFIFTANCRQHDFNYCRGGWLVDKLQADYDMCRCMWNDSQTPTHYVVTIMYYLGLTVLPFSYFFFDFGEYKTKEEILISDMERKLRRL